MRKRSRSTFKPGALTLAITFLLVQFGEIWHLAREQHVLCAEHGEWIEITTRSALSAAPATHGGPRVDGTQSKPDAHEHCALVLSSRSRGIVWEIEGFARLPGPILSTESTLRSDPVDAGFALYLLAPKQSPPS